MKDFRKVLLQSILLLIVIAKSAQVGFAQNYGGMPKKYHKSLLNKTALLKGAPLAQNGRYTTYSYTFTDLVLFSYFDDTNVDVLDNSGNVIWSGTLSENAFQTITPGAGTYGLRSTKPFSLLIGDPISLSVMGYYAVDERGKGVSTKFLTFMPKDEYGQERFVVFAYRDGTQVSIKNLSTGQPVWAGTLNNGDYYISSGLESTFLEVSASAGVSVLSYADQGYPIPAENGDWVGKHFYGYAGLVGGWHEDLNLISYENNSQITVKNHITGANIWSGTLNKGQIKSMTVTTNIVKEVFLDIQSTGNIVASISPYTAFTQNYFHLTGSVDESGTRIGTLFYIPAIGGGRLDFSSFEDNNNVTVRRMDSGAIVWSGQLEAGQNVTINTARALYEVKSSGRVTGVESFGGQAGADFRPVFYGINLPDIAISSSDIFVNPEFASVGNPVTLRAIVRNIGINTASLVKVRFYDGDPDQGGVLIRQAATIFQILPNGQATASVSWNVPQDPGHHRIYVVIDEDSEIDESNESNNKAERSFYPNNELQPPLALFITAPQGLSVDASGNYSPNPFNIFATISNNGSLACQNIVATLNLPNGLVLQSGQSSITIPSLASGQGITVSWQVRATGNPFGNLPYKITLNSANCGSKEGKRLIRIPDAPFAADITATWNGQNVGDVEVWVDRGSGFVMVGTISSPNTPLRVSGLSIGNKLRAIKNVHTEKAAKSGHGDVDDVMFEVWADSDVIQENRGDYDPFEITSFQNNFQLNIVHVIYKYNLIVSLEWDNSDDLYYSQLKKGFKKASRYLFNASDGQVMFNKIAIYDGKDHWLDADMQILNDQWPMATVDGIDDPGDQILPGGKIFFGKELEGKTPDILYYYSAIVHEFGHYAFGVRDEYKDGNGDQKAWNIYRRRHTDQAPLNYGVMDQPGTITEFSSANDYLEKYPQNPDKKKVNFHYYVKKQPTWNIIKEKLEKYFPEAKIKLPPSGYYPDGPRNDRLGPNYQSIENNTIVLDFRTNNILASIHKQYSKDIKLSFKYDSQPLPGAKIYAIYKRNRRYVGETDTFGRINFSNFHTDKKYEIYRVLHESILKAKFEINEGSGEYNGTTETAIIELQKAETILQDRGFTLLPDFSLSTNKLTFNFLMNVDAPLTGAPQLRLSYENTVDSTSMVLVDINQYTGQLEIDLQNSNFKGTGTLEVRAISASGEAINFYNSFRMFYLKRNDYPEVFSNNLEITFYPENLTADQYCLVSGTYAKPYMDQSLTLYPISAMYHIEVEHDSDLNGGAAVNLHYTEGEVAGLDETTLSLYKWDENLKKWIEVANSSISLNNNVVSTLIYTTGTYAVFAKVASGDAIPPGRVNTLNAKTGNGQGEIILNWTAPGDDNFSGKATSYVFRFNEVPITHLNWDISTTIFNSPQPDVSGTSQNFLVRLPNSNKLYYFAMKARDEAGNESDLSNNASAISGTGESPPDTSDCTQNFSDNFDDGTADGWIPNKTSRWTVRQVRGSNAYCLDVANSTGDEWSTISAATWGDFTLDLDAESTLSGSGKNYFILFGTQSVTGGPANAYYLQFRDGAVNLYRSVNNSGVIIATTPLDFVSDNQRHHIKVQRTGTTIKVFADGQSLFEVNDSMFGDGYIGFGAFKGTACFDNVVVTGSSQVSIKFSDDFDDGNANGWSPQTQSRWEVRVENGSQRYFLNTSQYDSPDGARLGELSLIDNLTLGDFIFECLAKSWDAPIGTRGADLCIVFGYQDSFNYYYAMYNSAVSLTAIHRVQAGVRTQLATYAQPTFTDGAYYPLRVERIGNTINTYFNGNLILTANDNVFGAGQFGVGSFNDSGYFDNIVISEPGCIAPRTSAVSIPDGMKVAAGSTIAVPGIVSTTEDIGLAQFTVEYNGNVLQFSNATIGPDAPGFSISQVQTNPPFPPTTPGADRNVVVQISGGGGNAFTGTGKTVVYLNFLAAGSVGDTTVLAFDGDCARTFLTTTSLKDICGTQLNKDNGSAAIILAPDVLGHVRYYDADKPVSGTSVTLSGAIQQTQTTDGAGFYQFANVPAGNYMLRASKNNDTRGAISGSDALALLKAVGFLINLTPGQEKAGDVDRNGSITPSDAVAVMRYLAFLLSGTANTGEWIFEPEVANIQVSKDVTQDFTAYLLGDVTGNWGASAAVAAKAQFVSLNINEAFRLGDSLSIPVWVPNEAAPVYTVVASLQWEMTVEKNVKFIPAKSGVYFALNTTDVGKTHLALACLDGFQVGEKIGKLVVQSPETGNDALQHVASVTSLQVNDRTLEERDILLAKPAANIPAQFELYQNYPNPFNINTTIRFGVPKLEHQQEIVLEIYSLTGQLVRRLYKGEAKPGFHTANWDGRDETGKIVGTGLYLYRLRSGAFAKSAKLLLVK